MKQKCVLLTASIILIHTGDFLNSQMKMATLVGRMFWTDKGPKFLVMLIILSLSIYMFSTLLGSKKVIEDVDSYQR